MLTNIQSECYYHGDHDHRRLDRGKGDAIPATAHNATAQQQQFFQLNSKGTVSRCHPKGGAISKAHPGQTEEIPVSIRKHNSTLGRTFYFRRCCSEKVGRLRCQRSRYVVIRAGHIIRAADVN